MARLAVAIDASGARRGAAEVNAALDSIKAKARAAVTEAGSVGDKLGASLQRGASGGGGISAMIGATARELGHLQSVAQAAATATSQALSGIRPADEGTIAFLRGLADAVDEAKDALASAEGAGDGLAGGVAKGADEAADALKAIADEAKKTADALEQSGKSGADALGYTVDAAGRLRDQFGRFVGAGRAVGAGVRSGTEQAKKALNDLGEAAGRVHDRIFSLQTAFAAIGIGLVAKSILDATKEAQGLEIRLRGLTSGSAAYAETMAWVRKTADELSANQNALAKTYANLLPFVNSGNISMDQAREIMVGMADAAASTGAPADQLQNAFFGLAQALGSANVQFDEVRQITDPMPGLMQKLDAAVASSGKTFKDVVSEGKLSASEFAAILIKALAGYEGAAAKARDTLGAVQERFGNVITELKVALGTPMAESLSPVIDKIAAKLRDPEFARAAEEFGDAIAVGVEAAGRAALFGLEHFRTLGGILAGIVAIKAGIFFYELGAAIWAAVTAVRALMAANALAGLATLLTGPVGIAVAAVAAAAGLAALATRETEVERASRQAADALEAYRKAAGEAKHSNDALAPAYTATANAARQAAIDQIKAAQAALAAAQSMARARQTIMSSDPLRGEAVQDLGSEAEVGVAEEAVAKAQAELAKLEAEIAANNKRLQAIPPPAAPTPPKLAGEDDAKKGRKTRTFADVLKDAEAERAYAQAVLQLSQARDKSALAIASETAQLQAKRELQQAEISATPGQLAQLNAVIDARVRAEEAAAALADVRQQGRDNTDAIALAERELAVIGETADVRARELVLVETKQKLVNAGLGVEQAEAEARALGEQEAALERIAALTQVGEQRRDMKVDLAVAQREVELVGATADERARELAYLETKLGLLGSGVPVEQAEAEADAVGRLAQELERAAQARSVKEGVRDAQAETRELRMQLASVRMMPAERERYRAIMGDILAMEERMGRELLPGERAELQGALADRERMRQELERQEEQQRRLEEIAEGWGDALADGFTRAALEGESVKDVLADIEQQLLSMMTKKLVTEPLADFLTGMIGSGISAAAGGMGGSTAAGTAGTTAAGGMGGSGFGNMAASGTFGGGFRTGGDVNGGGTRRVLPAGTWAGAPRFAQGFLGAGELPAILHHGERVLSAEVVRELRAQRRGGPGRGPGNPPAGGAAAPVVTLQFQAAPGGAAAQQRYAAGYTPAQLAQQTRRAIEASRRHGY